jgi:hypothetical protein
MGDLPWLHVSATPSALERKCLPTRSERTPFRIFCSTCSSATRPLVAFGAPAQLGARTVGVYHSMPTISVDATSASQTSQRYNVIVHSLYAVGVGRAGRSSWDLQVGLSGLSKIAEETGGECYSLGTSNPVSFKPYLERFQRTLDNQYYLVFLATPKKNAGLQRFNIQTEVSNFEIVAPDNVWVPAANELLSAPYDESSPRA